jgi:hypothetical protein
MEIQLPEIYNLLSVDLRKKDRVVREDSVPPRSPMIFLLATVYIPSLRSLRLVLGVLPLQIVLAPIFLLRLTGS